MEILFLAELRSQVVMGDPSYGDTISYGVTAVVKTGTLRAAPTFSNGGINVGDESGTSSSSSDKATSGAENANVVEVSMKIM
ncbi:uncharacterized protein PITG_10404 [Phytophthora infestans T30-4]|uniref:Uncharacterized protein n=1 Tax=Phytophthora infestans (strain T30-4) TaxID=403677 RepID=D0NF88_PHYIT|nr:uncharacterized protein PITG_10404 [Phytophthora infestans T30-4]EEY56877.1 hypothetical protein PITG_10404 [Phytophthora infestans T30-4]|eukprot:XP_002902205.1 hypothetical protein PITG_10404 [Phytophthora infestans T30-4]